MSNRSIFCIATSRPRDERIVNQLKEANFSSSNISALFSNKEANDDFAYARHTKVTEGGNVGAGNGGIAGGTPGWIAGIGALAVPGVGALIAAGPILATLSGAAMGATLGGVAGGLIGVGIPELVAKRYERKLKDGNILISVQTGLRGEIDLAMKIFAHCGADDICTVPDSSIPEPSYGQAHSEGCVSARTYADEEELRRAVVVRH